MVGGHRRQAPSADRGDAGALGLDPAPGLRDRRPRRPAPLRRRGPGRASAPCPASGSSSSGSNRWPISAASPSRSSPHAARTTASSPRSPRLRRRVSMFPRSGSIESVGSSASSWARRRTEAVPIRIPGRSAVGTAERVARVVAREVGADGQPGRVGRGHVLRRVHGDVDPPVEQRLLELLDEDAAVADLAERAAAVAVAGGRDRDERDLAPGRASSSAASAACVSASRLPREPSRKQHYSRSSPRSNRCADGLRVAAAVGAGGGLLQPHRRQVEQLVDDLRRDRLDRLLLRLGEPRRARVRAPSSAARISSARARSDAIAGTTSRDACHSRKLSASSATIASARAASRRRPARLEATTDSRSSMSYR